MRRVSTILFWIAGVCFLATFLGTGLVIYSSKFASPVFLKLIGYFVLVPMAVPILIVVGILLRLFASRTSSLESDFSFWRKSLLMAIIIWFMSLLGMAMLSDSGTTPSFYVLWSAYLAALPIAIVALIAAHYQKKSNNLSRAVLILKLPFYYGAIIVVVMLGSAILGKLPSNSASPAQTVFTSQ